MPQEPEQIAQTSGRAFSEAAKLFTELEEGGFRSTAKMIEEIIDVPPSRVGVRSEGAGETHWDVAHGTWRVVIKALDLFLDATVVWRELQARKPIEHFSNGCGRPGFERCITLGLHNLFPDEIGAAEIEEGGEGVGIEGGGTGRTNDFLKAVVKRTEKIGVGRRNRSSDGGGHAKRLDQTGNTGTINTPILCIKITAIIPLAH
ncbi:translation initiation factor EIF-2B subunit, putative [Babesia caballi]|uniref:Translation initiation factor EIF-2B subunit, putative n=1 Tax=Babesia caballi TaxID=5871 RepID=A0AAV4LRG4_BABCB|nr:translation initiation factor EIF-2B subunit, putative [Babesia caballi]